MGTQLQTPGLQVHIWYTIELENYFSDRFLEQCGQDDHEDGTRKNYCVNQWNIARTGDSDLSEDTKAKTE